MQKPNRTMLGEADEKLHFWLKCPKENHQDSLFRANLDAFPFASPVICWDVDL